MPKKSQEEKSFLNMAGEFLVAAELNRRRVLCAVTYGTAKCADVWAFARSGDRAARVEVKTTGPGSQRWVIGEKALHPDASSSVFWVLVLLPDPQPTGPSEDDTERGRHTPRFFVLKSEEIQGLLDKNDRAYQEAYRAKHGCDFTGIGVESLNLVSVKEFENGWDKIERQVKP